MIMKRSWIFALAILGCLAFAWATGAGRPYPANAGGVIDPTCTSSLPCIEYDNNGTGPGIRGISVSGNGLAGATKNHGTSAANGRAGMIGNDIGTGTFNSGVHGLSVNGTGVSGQSTSGAGVSGQSTNNDGVDGFTSNPTLTHSARNGVFGLDNSSDGGHGNGGVGGLSVNGIGVAGTSFNFVGVNVIGGGPVSSDDYPALSIIANKTGVNPNDLIDACLPGAGTSCSQNNSQNVLRIDGVGDIFPSGNIVSKVDIVSNASFDVMGSGEYFKNGTCVAGCTVSASSARRVRSYSAQSSLPMIEDNGEAQLVGGGAYVRLDRAFANVIDQRSSYSVSITPEGDSNGLFVTEKTLTGFAVRENHGGRSTLAFEYRIVAKPFGATGTRLPMVEVPLWSRHMPTRLWHPGAVVPVH